MKKYLFLIISCLFISIIFVGCSSGKKTVKETSSQAPKEKKIVKNLEEESRAYIETNKIREIDKINFLVDSDGKPLKGNKSSSLVYSENGRLEKTIAYNTDGKASYIYKYEFDKNGKRIKTIRYTPKNEVDKYYNYKYNKYGNKIKSTRFSPDGKPDEYYIYQYDDDGNLTVESWYDVNNNLLYKIKYEYDDGKKESYKTYDQNGDLISKYVYKYDDKGNIVEEERYNNDGDKIGVIQYVYLYY